MHLKPLRRRIREHIDTLEIIAATLPQESQTDEKRAERSRICLEVALSEADRWAMTLAREVSSLPIARPIENAFPRSSQLCPNVADQF